MPRISSEGLKGYVRNALLKNPAQSTIRNDKPAGSRACSCGKTISANKRLCLTCQIDAENGPANDAEIKRVLEVMADDPHRGAVEMVVNHPTMTRTQMVALIRQLVSENALIQMRDNGLHQMREGDMLRVTPDDEKGVRLSVVPRERLFYTEESPNDEQRSHEAVDKA